MELQTSNTELLMVFDALKDAKITEEFDKNTPLSDVLEALAFANKKMLIRMIRFILNSYELSAI